MVRIHRHIPAVAAALLVCLAAAGTAIAQQALPRLEVEPTQFDLGRMEQEQVRHLTVTLRNTGQAPLRIEDVETSCGCTAAKPDRDELQPGESTRLQITFNSKKFDGPQLKEVTIRTNDPHNPAQKVEIRVDVHAPLHIRPRPQMGFNRVGRGETPENTVVISTDDVPELEITPEKYRRDLFDVTISPASAQTPAAREVTVTLRPDAPIGMFRELITLRTNVPDAPTVDLEAAGEVVAPVMIDPAKVNLRYLQRGQEIRRVFHVRIQKGHQVKVTRAETDLPGFRVEKIQFVPESNEYLVYLFGRPISTHDERAVKSRGRMKGTVRVFTDSAEFPELTASIMYLLRI